MTKIPAVPTVLRAARLRPTPPPMSPLFELSASTLASDRACGLDTEWLETNGLGDFASSSLWMCPTRRYHAWLVARPEGLEKRHVFLSRFEEEVRSAAGNWPMSGALYADGMRPAGHANLHSFELDPHPRSKYRSGEQELERELQMLHGRKGSLLRYTNHSKESLVLALRPLLPCREADALTVRNEVLDGTLTPGALGFSCQPYAALPALHFALSTTWDFEPEARWEQGIELPVDEARGYPHHEDHFSPGTLSIQLAAGASVVLAITIESTIEDPLAAWESESARRQALVEEARQRNTSSTALRLDLGGADFSTRVEGRAGINAGFPWFVEWGRDTFIALPGLTLARGRLDACEEVLSQSLGFLQHGLLPNIFGLTRASSHYGSVDASLWYARAVQLYAAAGGSEERLLDEYLPALLEIASNYWEGTGLGIAADAAGMIHAGSSELNATWMDAMTSAGPVTPRAGCAVEINALWYSLLRQVELFTKAKRRSPTAHALGKAAQAGWQSFPGAFLASQAQAFGRPLDPRGRGRTRTPQHGLGRRARIQPAQQVPTRLHCTML